MIDPDDTVEINELVELMREAASAYIGGNVRLYLELMRHADDFTLMSPLGGETIRADKISNVDEQIAAEEAFFHGGECALEVVECYASGALAVLVAEAPGDEVFVGTSQACVGGGHAGARA